jgi:hypothetical protein
LYAPLYVHMVEIKFNPLYTFVSKTSV